jgi:hypothetical protein
MVMFLSRQFSNQSNNNNNCQLNNTLLHLNMRKLNNMAKHTIKTLMLYSTNNMDSINSSHKTKMLNITNNLCQISITKQDMVNQTNNMLSSKYTLLNMLHQLRHIKSQQYQLKLKFNKHQ